MKKLIILLAVLLAMAASGFAQGKLSFYGGGGMGMPISPKAIKDHWGMGFNAGGGIGYMVQPKIELIGRFTFNTFPLDADKYETDFGLKYEGWDFRVLQFEADIKYFFTPPVDESPFRPFSIIGIGMSNITYTDRTLKSGTETISRGYSDATKLSLDAGLGFDYMFSPKFGMFLDARLAIVLTEGDSFGYIPLKAGIKIALGE